jgi:hypothetical protein
MFCVDNPIKHAARHFGVALMACCITSACTSERAPEVSDLRMLSWIEGTWRGSGGGVAPFYERYQLSDDSTLVIESFEDSTLSNITETSYYELRDGRVTSRGERQYIAEGIAADSIVFAPLRGVNNSFVWKRGTENEWTATILPENGSPRTYAMVRMQ